MSRRTFGLDSFEASKEEFNRILQEEIVKEKKTYTQEDIEARKAQSVRRYQRQKEYQLSMRRGRLLFQVEQCFLHTSVYSDATFGIKVGETISGNPGVIEVRYTVCVLSDKDRFSARIARGLLGNRMSSSAYNIWVKPNGLLRHTIGEIVEAHFVNEEAFGAFNDGRISEKFWKHGYQGVEEQLFKMRKYYICKETKCHSQQF